MSVSVLISTYGDGAWERLGSERARPSAEGQGAQVISHYEREGTCASSRNSSAIAATGDWLCFLDADDELAPGYIGAMERALEQHSGAHRVLLTPRVQHVRKGPPGAPFFYKECSLTTGNWLVIGTLISRSLFWEIGGFEEYPHGLEDWVLWAKAVKAGATIVKVRDAVYIAHLNPKSKHHELARDRAAYRVAYERARASVWG